VKAKPPSLRADAERNRQRVLEIAHEVFAAEGLSVRVDEIARRAGVGVGTVYRHFPTKDALFQAIFVDRIERLIAEAEQLADGDDPGAAFFALVEHLVAEGVAKKDLVDALGGGARAKAGAGSTRTRLLKSLGKLLARAQEAGVVRDDVEAADVFSLVRGVLADSDAPARSRARHVAILCDGLRRAPRTTRTR